MAVAVVVLGAAFVALRPEPAAAPQDRTIDVSVRGDAMTPEEITVTEGDTVTLRVTADRAIELHLHGYDTELEVEPGEPAEIEIEATLTGRFEIEDEPTETELGTLVVRPREGGE